MRSKDAAFKIARRSTYGKQSLADLLGMTPPEIGRMVRNGGLPKPDGRGMWRGEALFQHFNHRHLTVLGLPQQTKPEPPVITLPKRKRKVTA